MKQFGVQGPTAPRKVDVRLPGNENSDYHGARPVHLSIKMMKRTRTSRLSIQKSLSVGYYRVAPARVAEFGVYRGTSLIRNRQPVGPYSRTMPTLLWRS